jgi:hypothetical protein
VQAHSHAAVFQTYRLRRLRFQKPIADFNHYVTLRHSKSECSKSTLFLGQEGIIESFRYIRIKFKKAGHFINVIEESPYFKNHPYEEDMSGNNRTSDHPFWKRVVMLEKQLIPTSVQQVHINNTHTYLFECVRIRLSIYPCISPISQSDRPVIHLYI